MPARFGWPGAVALVGVVALVLRLLHVFQIDGTPITAVLVGDGRAYDLWAQQIAAGQWLGSEVFYQSPLYAYLLAITYAVGGHDVLTVRLLQAVAGACSCVLLGLAGRRLFSPRVGLGAAALLAIYPPAIFFDGLVQKAALDALLATLVLACLGEILATGRRRWLVAAGIALGVFALNRENARILFPVIASWLLVGFRTTPFRARLVRAAIFSVAMTVVLAPVALRNFHVGGEFLLSTSLGPNFYIGNHPGATGFYEPLVEDRGDAIYEREDARRLAVAAMGRDLSPGEVSDFWLGRAFEYIRSQPGSWLRGVGKKLLLTFNAREAVDTESIEVYAEYSFVLRALIWFNFGIVLPLAVLGVWRTRADWRRLAVLYAMMAALVASIGLFFVFARFRYPLVPLLMLFASAAGCSIGRVNGDWRRHWLPGLALAIVFAIGSNLPLPAGRDGTYWSIGAELVRAGRPAEAIPLLERAATAMPDFAPARLDLGLALNQVGERQRAVEAFAAALRIRPDFAAAHSALGVTLQEMDKPAEALPHFFQAVRLAPDDAKSQWSLGLALSKAGRRQEAIAAYKESVRLNSDDPRAHTNLAGLLLQEGLVAEALTHLEASVRLEPTNAEARVNLATAQKGVGSDQAAIAQLREAVRLKPNFVEARLNLGALLADTGQVAAGLNELQQAARLAPDSIDPYYLSALIYGRAKRWSEAIQALEQALANARATGRSDAIPEIEDTLRTCLAEAGGKRPQSAAPYKR